MFTFAGSNFEPETKNIGKSYLMSKIFITGDTHGMGREMRKLNSSSFPAGKLLTKDDYVIILGDFGWLWYHDKHPKYKSDLYWLKWLHEKPWTTLFIDGNHENYDLLDQLAQVEKFDGIVGKVNESVFHLKRGYVYQLANRSFFTFGGAESSDKEERKAGISWWPQEIPTEEEKAFGLESLAQYENRVDFVLTHTAPSTIIQKITGEKSNEILIRIDDSTAKYLEQIARSIQFTKWYFGHFHMDLPDIQGKYYALYETVIRLI